MPQPSDERLVAWRAFLEAHAAVIDVLTKELDAAEDLQLTWYDVLVQLSEAEDRRLRMQELADRVVLSKSGLTRLVQRMEDDGLVRREPCEDDRRGIYAVLTGRGLERLRHAWPVHRDGVQQHFTSLLQPNEVLPLARALRRVAQAARATPAH